MKTKPTFLKLLELLRWRSARRVHQVCNTKLSVCWVIGQCQPSRPWEKEWAMSSFRGLWLVIRHFSEALIGRNGLRTQSPTLNQKTPPGKLFKVTFGSRTDSAARTLFPEPCIPWSVRNFPGVSSDKPFFIAASYKNRKNKCTFKSIINEPKMTTKKEIKDYLIYSWNAEGRRMWNTSFQKNVI